MLNTQANRFLKVALFVIIATSVSIVGAQSKPGSANRGVGTTVTLDNGLTGDGQWRVDSGAGGDTRFGELDPAGSLGPENLIFDFFTYVDPGIDGGAIALSDTTVASSATQTGPQEATSSGSFAGPNGQIDWTAVATVPAGEQIYEVDITFSSSSPFGDVRIINYFDQDVFGVSDDVLILLGTPGASDFQMLTLDDTDDVGIGHFAGYQTATNASYIGFAADEFSDLRSVIEGAGTSFSVSGNIDTTDLVPTTDSRFPSADAYGPADITGAYAFDLSPTATSAGVQFSLGGSVSGEVPGGEPAGPQVPIPTLGTIGMLLMTMLMLALAWRSGLIGARR